MALHSSPHQRPIDPSSSACPVAHAQLESLLLKFEAHSVAHRRLENRVAELEEQLLSCQQALRDERARVQDVTQLATQQLQEWTLEGIPTRH